MPVLIDQDGEWVELRPGGGDLRYSSEAFAGWDGGPLLGGRPVSYARMFATQPWVAVTVMRLLTWAIRVPLKTYRRTGPDGGDKERLRPGEHPLADALAAPWKRGSQADLVMAALGPQCVQGNGLVAVHSPLGRFSFEPIDWRFVTAVHEVETDPTSPIVAWKVFPPGGEPYSIGASNVLHFRWWSPFGQLGVSPLRQLQTTLRNESAAMDWAVNNLRNAWRPSGVVELSDQAMQMNPEQMYELYERSVQKLREKYSGPENAGRLPVIPPGLKWATAEQTTAVEAELINQRMVNRNEVAAIYQIPPPMIGQLERSTFNNITTLREMAYTDALGPPLVLIEQTLNAHLVREILAEDDIFVEFDFAAILRGDRLKEIQALREGVTSGLVTPNEGRGVLNLPHDEHPDADRIWMPTNNLAPIGGESPPAPPSQNGRASKEAARARLN